jgi:hypothetical protein
MEGAVAGCLKSVPSAAMQQARIFQSSHDVQERVDAGVGFIDTGQPCSAQRGQANVQDVGKAALRFFASAARVEVAPGLCAVRRGGAGPTIGQRGERGGAPADIFRVQPRALGSGRDQQAERPDGAAMCIDAAGGQQHRALCATAKVPEPLAQIEACCAMSGKLGHGVEAGLERTRRAKQEVCGKIVMRAAAAQIGQGRLGCQGSFIAQGLGGPAGEQARHLRTEAVGHALVGELL